jgi:phage shock protein A
VNDDDLARALIRLEGKVDNLSTGLRAEITALSKHSETLAEMLRLQLTNTNNALEELKLQLAATRAHADHAVSTARVDVERQLAEHKVEAERVHDAIELRMTEARADRQRLWERTDAHATSLARISGAAGVGIFLGLSGLAALVRGLTG